MQTPVQVTFRDMPVSDAVESQCWTEADKLEHVFDRMTACHVVIADSSRRRHKGNLYDVRIHVAIPGTTLVVDRTPPEHAEDENIQVAVHDAFERMRRQVHDHIEKQRDHTKHAASGATHGRIARLRRDEGYGFIAADDGRDVYFQRHNVPDDGFERLSVGHDVHFVEEESDRGLRAASVIPAPSSIASARRY